MTTTTTSGGAITARRAARLAESVGAVYRLDDVADLLQIGKRTAERLLAEGKLPQPDIRLSRRCLRWRESTISKFINGKAGGAR